MEKPRDAIYYKGYTRGYLDGYRAGVNDIQKGKYRNLMEDDIAQLPIEAMEITSRAYHCLIGLGCQYVSDLLSLDEKELQRARGLGAKTAAEIARWLDDHGFPHTPWSRYL